ncbi:APC family permease [Arthrobacter agilis]|uniref:APC family permease n=1 Tax=Arthrobacter agilis TaxID=37921 RepID=UPI000B35094F|nr:APC family permease [Arthrobacter agilis]OUM40608.1 amino acid permease [Arthrobacter agilis]PPB45219.1 APC family permease [Arthrobacter agilis]TPV27922.1 APC family permease [Arthrobacter agilis]VDR31396.1 Lysine-specific permease [Arthrobacter agilis]
MSTRNSTRGAGNGQDASLLKVLGNWDALALGFGAMIGFGWVVLTGGWIASAGTGGAVLAMVTGGVIMGVVGLTYAELTAAMPKAGGEHNFLLRGMGPRWSFVGSWAITGGYVTIVAFEAVALPRTAEYIFPNLSQVPLWTVAGDQVHLTWALVGAVAAVVITLVNIRGVKIAGSAQSFVVVFLLILGSFTGGSTTNMQPFFTGGSAGFFAVLVVVPFLFVGFDVIPQSAEEVDIPARQIGRLVVVAVILATIWYVMTILTTSAAMPAADLAAADIATADAMGAMFGSDAMAKVLIAGGIAGILTSWNSLLLGASRLMYSMSRSGMLPRWFGVLHPRYRTPVNALIFIGALSFAAPFFGTQMLGWLVDSGAPSIVLAYILVSLVFVILRRRDPGMDRPLRIGGAGNGGVVIGWVAVVLCVALLSLYLPGMPAALTPPPWILFGLWWVLGIVFLLRIPSGIAPGHDAEERLLERLAERR